VVILKILTDAYHNRVNVEVAVCRYNQGSGRSTNVVLGCILDRDSFEC
jgi:hypothetical protein